VKVAQNVLKYCTQNDPVWLAATSGGV